MLPDIVICEASKPSGTYSYAELLNTKTLSPVTGFSIGFSVILQFKVIDVVVLSLQAYLYVSYILIEMLFVPTFVADSVPLLVINDVLKFCNVGLLA